MLLALTSRPLATSVALARKPESSCTSLAVARACRPRRLDTVNTCSSIVDDGSIACARCGGGGQLVQPLLWIVHHPQQHRQAQCRDAADRCAQLSQPCSQIARAGPV